MTRAATAVLGVVALAVLCRGVPAGPAAGDDAASWFDRGEAHFAAKEMDQALTCYRKALGLAPDHARAACRIGVIQAEKGMLVQAQAMLTRAIQADPALADARYYAGLVSERRRQARAAVTHLEAAIRLAPDHWQARAALVRLYQVTGNAAKRDEQRGVLMASHKKGRPADLVKAVRYRLDAFTVKRRSILAYEYFEPKGDQPVRYGFYVMDPRGRKTDYRVTLGSYKVLNEIARDQGKLKEGQRAFHLDSYLADGSYVNHRMFYGEPSYDTVRAVVVALVEPGGQPGANKVSEGRDGTVIAIDPDRMDATGLAALLLRAVSAGEGEGECPIAPEPD